MRSIRWAVALAALAGVTVSTLAAAKLKVGDPAPKLQIGKWVQGEPVTQFANDKAYIVEFWATWCGPCRQSIPHLNEIHSKFKGKGLVVIGQDVWEEDEDGVPKFIKEMGDKMTYRVALDDKNGEEKGKMAKNWMEAAGQNGIPTAFLIGKDGKIAWIGHPMSLKEEVIEDVLAGTYDLKKAVADYEKRQKNEEIANAAWQNFNNAAKDKDWDKAEGHLKELEQVLDEDERTRVDMIRLRMNLQKPDMATAEAVAKKMAAHDKEDAQYQNALAWAIATTEGVSAGLLDIAEKSAKLADDLSKGTDPEIIDTVARIQFVRGNKEAAIASQQKAIELAEANAKSHYQKTLESYKAGKVPE